MPLGQPLDETYIKVKGDWKYLYRAVDKQGKTIDFLLTAKRDKAAALRFFDKAMQANGGAIVKCCVWLVDQAAIC